MITDLIKNTGIQYISIPVNISEQILKKVNLHFAEELVDQTDKGDIYSLKEVYSWKEEELFLDKRSINPEAYTRYGELNPEDIKRDFIDLVEEDDMYSVRGAEALDVCKDHWIPLPYFQIRGEVDTPYHHGPENWCRCNLQEHYDIEKNTTHILTLAFDTNTDDSSSEYLKPRSIDANDNGSVRFKCVSDKRHAPKYYTDYKLWDWMFNLFWLNKNAGKYKETLRHVAIYHVFVDLLKQCEVFPEVGLLSGDNSIEVGLTLDIGNSRTCGLICEKTRPFDSLPFDFTSARKLQIRNLAKPHLICEDPFEMQVAFSEEKFGNPAAELLFDVFEWPSLLRVGPEAVDLTSIFESEDSQATLSSPKRYLWNKKPVKVPWIKVDKDGRLGYHDTVNIRKNALYGIAEYVTSEGKLIKDSQLGMVMGATESRYSRSSLMMFSIYEILLHAISQINNHEFRKDLGNSTYRRVLKDLVITCPTAMTDQEQYELRKSAVDACTLIGKTIGGKLQVPDLQIEVTPKVPNLDRTNEEVNPWKFDEATCSQLAFLYGELVHKFSSKQELFFDLKGKYREGAATKSLNVASIDIGGGTTDLMIANYSYDKNADVPYITPKPLFWEGFSIAGDDIVKRIIEKIFIKGISEKINRLTGKNFTGLISELFGQNVGGQSAKNRIFRRQFANQIAAPFAYVILERLSNGVSNTDSICLNQVFEKYKRPQSGLIDYLNSTIMNKTGLEEFDLCEIEIEVDVLSVNNGIKDIIEDVLKQLCYLISYFDCDLVLLSGRPSTLPIVTDIVSSTLSFSLDKVVRLGNYRFGNWYPFANSSGFVNDPKSTVCVGSLIAYLNNNGRLPGMRFDFEYLKKIKTTASYLGVLNNDSGRGRILSPDLLLSPLKNEGSFKFYGEPIVIAMKQLESEDWTATPLYVFDYKDDERRGTMLGQGFKFPYEVTIRRMDSVGEFLKKDELEVVDGENTPIDSHNFNFSLRTSKSLESHWRDSGSFIVRID
jgi:hypothetical protein